MSQNCRAHHRRDRCCGQGLPAWSHAARASEVGSALPLQLPEARHDPAAERAQRRPPAAAAVLGAGQVLRALQAQPVAAGHSRHLQPAVQAHRAACSEGAGGGATVEQRGRARVRHQATPATRQESQQQQQHPRSSQGHQQQQHRPEREVAEVIVWWLRMLTLAVASARLKPPPGAAYSGGLPAPPSWCCSAVGREGAA